MDILVKMTEKELTDIGFIKQKSKSGNNKFQHLRYQLANGVEIVLFGHNNDWRGQEFQQLSNEETMDTITIPKHLANIGDVKTLISSLT